MLLPFPIFLLRKTKLSVLMLHELVSPALISGHLINIKKDFSDFLIFKPAIYGRHDINFWRALK